jgi:RNA recognition motif-containing protein
MANKLYVGGISFNTSEDGLREAFAQAGNVVSATIITDRETGRSKGFGFVEMSTDAEAEAAVQMWDGQMLEGRKLTVNPARPKTDRPRFSSRPRGNYQRD